MAQDKTTNAQTIQEYFADMAVRGEQACQNDDNQGMASIFRHWHKDITTRGIERGTAKTLEAIAQIIKNTALI